MSRTKIEWATDTWNPITGCTHAGSPGCDNCYARRMAKRLAGRFGYPESPHEFDVTFHPDRLDEPLRWRKPRVVFVCSMGDLFHEGVETTALQETFTIMQTCNNHIFLVLTKRPRRMRDFLTWWLYPYRIGKQGGLGIMAVLPNVWLGVSVETQDQMWRVVPLAGVPAAKHFVSFEPLLGPIDCANHISQLDGVIVGGESGPGARRIDADWVRSIRDRCVIANVPFTFKQWGGTDKKSAGRELDGVIWDQFPWTLIKREMRSELAE